jgi:hypothetical protein
MEQDSRMSSSKPNPTSLLVHEIPDDETGYDADVEVLRPDEYEEPDSEGENAPSSSESEERWRDELVEHMKSLSCHPDARGIPHEDDSSRGRKRRSKDAFGVPGTQLSTGPSENQMEVAEIADDQDSRPRLKRLRRRSRRSKTENKLIHVLRGSEREAEEASVGNGGARGPQGESIETESSAREHQDDAMDLD